MAVLSMELVQPYADRSNEGILFFNVEFSPMASPNFEDRGRPGPAAVSVARLIEKSFRETRSVDLEALVAVAGTKVWSLRVDVHVLDHDGNIADAASLASLGALSICRIPIVEAKGTDVIVHGREAREGMALRLHHHPLAVTLGLVSPRTAALGLLKADGQPAAASAAAEAAESEGARLLVDPGLREEPALDGSITIVVNNQGDVCSIMKAGGCGLPVPRISECVRLSMEKAAERLTVLKAALEAHKVARVQARVRTQYGAKLPPALQTTLASGRGLGAEAVAVVDVDALLAYEAAEEGAEAEAATDAEAAALEAEMDSDASSSSDEEEEEADDGAEEMGDEPEEAQTAPRGKAAEPHAPSTSGRGARATESGKNAAEGEGDGHPGVGVRAPPKAAAAATMAKKTPTRAKRPFRTAGQGQGQEQDDGFGDIAALIGAPARQGGAGPSNLADAVKPGKKAKKGGK